MPNLSLCLLLIVFCFGLLFGIALHRSYSATFDVGYIPQSQQLDYEYLAGEKFHHVQQVEHLMFAQPQQYEFALVSDLDQKSRDPQLFQWHSFMLKGILRRNARGNFTIEWGQLLKLTSAMANKNRSMELSELIKSRHSKQVLAMCDYTGIIYEISASGKVFQRHAVADGNGRDPKPFKIEWATEKGDLLYLGSIGKEWTISGRPAHYNPEWVKTLDRCGRFRNVDWSSNYQALRKATNTTFPGYLWHEAVVWHEALTKWLFLPRKESRNTPYDELLDQRLGSNLLLIADENFSTIDVRRVGPLECEWGFTSMKLIPDTNEILAIKAYEVGNETKTYITVFDLDGHYYLEPEWKQIVSDTIKYEGLAFL